MKKSGIIVLVVCLLLLNIVILVSFIYCFGGIQNDIFNGKRPTDIGASCWVSEDGTSWFEVNESSGGACFGELKFRNEILRVCYEFEHFDRISIYVNDKSQVSINDGEVLIKDDTICFYGIWEWGQKNSEIVMNITKEDNYNYTEEIVFKRR